MLRGLAASVALHAVCYVHYVHVLLLLCERVCFEELLAEPASSEKLVWCFPDKLPDQKKGNQGHNLVGQNSYNVWHQNLRISKAQC